MGHTPVAELLLTRGAVLNAINKVSAIMLQIRKQKAEVIRINFSPCHISYNGRIHSMYRAIFLKVPRNIILKIKCKKSRRVVHNWIIYARLSVFVSYHDTIVILISNYSIMMVIVLLSLSSIRVPLYSKRIMPRDSSYSTTVINVFCILLYASAHIHYYIVCSSVT